MSSHHCKYSQYKGKASSEEKLHHFQSQSS